MNTDDFTYKDKRVV